MQHVIIEQCQPGIPLPLPHFVKKPEWNRVDYFTAIVESKREIKVGDQIGWIQRTGEEENFNPTGTITTIVERRKAKGNWSTNKYDTAPDFIKFKTTPLAQ